MTKKEINWPDISKTFARKELPESEVEFIGEIPGRVVALYKDEALAHIASELELPGFRKGHVPADIALKKVGEIAALEESVEMLMRDLYPALITEHATDAVGRPDIRITKLASGQPVGLTVRTAVYPTVMIPNNWKDIASKIPLEPYTGELPKTEPPPSPEEEQKARDYMARDIRRGKIIDALLEKTQVAVPKIFVESELDKIMSQMREDVARFGMTFEIYLKQINKSEDAIRNEFKDQATKRAKLQLVLNKLAADEKIDADKNVVDKEMKHAVEHFPKANQELLRIHIETVLRNEKALKILEGKT
ncbi:MAG: trigger factor [Minisyncoccia bacterium]|jgi:FKBP-type peptidyl-prolyl cis-trans isomerase (trigger factor)